MVSTQWVHDHLSVVHGIMVALLVGSISCFGFWLLTTDPPTKVDPSTKPSAPLPVETKEQRTRDVNGNLLQADKIEYHEAPAPVPSYQVNKFVEKKPVLAISEHSGHEYLTYEPAEAIWNIDGKGQRMLVVPVANPIPEDSNGESIKARRISVRLVFRFETHVVMDIERAYWVGESANEIELIGGKKKNVLVGFPRKGEWCSYENTHDTSYTTSDWGGRRSWRNPPTEKSIPFPEGSSLQFEVSVLYTSGNGAVSRVASKLFIVKVVTPTGVFHCEAVKA